METGTRSKDIASIVLLGLTGAGKSTTFSTTFGTQAESVANFTSSTSTILENSIEVPIPGQGTKELIVIDTPGFGDTRQRAFERDAQLLATLDDFLKNHKQLGHCYPSLVMLVMKFNDDRIIHETSHFIQMLKAINNFVSHGTLIDNSRSCSNLVVVLTHIMSEQNEHLRIDPTPKIKIISSLFKEYTNLSPPYFMVMAENKPETFNLQNTGGTWLLPNGDQYPYNLSKQIEKVTSTSKDTVANEIFREAFKNPAGLKKTLKTQVHLMPVESPKVNRYFITLKNSKFKIENSEISMKIASIWNSLPEHLTANSGSILEHVQKNFHQNDVLTFKDMPKTSIKVVKILSSLPITPAVVQVIKELGIQAPDYPDGVAMVGKFYNIATDEFTLSTPYDFSTHQLSNVGFMVPVGIKVEEIFEENLICGLFKTREEYNTYRLKELRLHKEVPGTLLKGAPKPGCDFEEQLTKTGMASGIKEFRIYKISTTRLNFSDEYTKFLKDLPPFKPKSKTKLPPWQEYIKKGTHVLKSAYAGGYVVVKVKRRAGEEQKTSPEMVKYTIEKMLSKVGHYSSEDYGKNIPEFEYTIDFVGGDKNLAKVDVSRMFANEGTEFVKRWEGSLRLHPVALCSEMRFENVADCLPDELRSVEPNIRVCLVTLMGFMDTKAEELLQKERDKSKCMLM